MRVIDPTAGKLKTHIGGCVIDIHDVVFAKCYCGDLPQTSCSDAYYYVLRPETFDEFLSNLESIHKYNDEISDLKRRLHQWKVNTADSDLRTEYELLCKHTFGIAANPPQSTSATSSVGLNKKHRTLLNQLSELSENVLSEFAGEEFTVYRGLGFDLGKIGEQLLNNPQAKSYRITTNTIFCATLHRETGCAYSPVLLETSVTPEQVILALDCLFIFDPSDPRTEAEIHVNGDAIHTVDRSDLYSWQLQQPLYSVIQVAENGDPNESQHAAMAEIVSQLVVQRNGRIDPRDDIYLSDEAQQRIERWFDKYVEMAENDGFTNPIYGRRGTQEKLSQAVAVLCR